MEESCLFSGGNHHARPWHRSEHGDFSVLYASLLAPMPYPDADRLMMVWSKIDDRNVVSAGDFIEWKRQTKTFQDMQAWTGGSIRWWLCGMNEENE